MTDLDALIAKLEAATEGSRLLDGLIWQALGNPVPRCQDWPYKVMAPPWTSSIDAALTLVPGGWSFRLWRHPGEYGCHCGVYLLGSFRDGKRPVLESEDAEQCATPALALTVAALKARRAAND